MIELKYENPNWLIDRIKKSIEKENDFANDERGNFGHSGRIGQRGGSAKRDNSIVTTKSIRVMLTGPYGYEASVKYEVPKNLEKSQIRDWIEKNINLGDKQISYIY